MLTVLSSERVVLSEATPKVLLWLSNIDLLAAQKAHVARIYFYWPNGSTRQDFFSVESLKSSLAKVLIPFYPLAGCLSVDQHGWTQINCNGVGALFIVARYDGKMADLEPLALSPERKHLFVPPGGQQHLTDTLLMVQVTFFKCGGVALGIAMHHILVDGRSAFHFMESWSKIACGSTDNADPPIPPFFDHTLLHANPVPKIIFDHSEYKSSPKSATPRSDIPTLYATSVQELSKEQIDALKLGCRDGHTVVGAHVSTFCAVTTLVWRCFCRARNLDGEAESKLYTMIDVCSRMEPPLPPTYFGNAVVCSSVTELVANIISSPINRVARRVREVTKKGNDFTRSFINYLETLDMQNLSRGSVPDTELRVISWLGMLTRSADLGWGKLICFTAVHYVGFVYVMDSLLNDGSVAVVASLEPESLAEFDRLFQEEAAALDV